jgi:indole-3-glycerol phosphate synthase
MRSTTTILDRILERKREEIKAAREITSLETLRDRARSAPPVRDFRAALAADGVSVIAEIKRASPSAGAFAPDLDASELARAYEAGGASAISVLTDADFFQGSPDDLKSARDATIVPVLRKDFILDPYQVYESRVMGADAILLIVAALDDVPELLGLATDIGLHCLVEVHDGHEIQQAVAAGANIIGVNNRDLRTFDTDLETTERLRPEIPSGVILVSESGIKTAADVRRLTRAGVDAVLVGESLVRSADPASALRALRGAGDA